jgi:hypothetical protein
MHSVESEYDAPPLHPQIVSYHAVSNFIRKQRATSALPAAKIGIVRNAVDLARFGMKSVIKTRPERALAVLNNNAGIPDTSTLEDTTAQFTITLSDDATAPTNLVVTVTGNTNPTLVPNSNIAISIIPNSAQRSVSITPAPNENGKTKITIAVTDTDGFSSSATFELTVTSVNDNPTISSIPSQAIIKSSATGSIPFTVADLPNETPADQLQVLASSSNISLVPNNKIVIGGSVADGAVVGLALAAAACKGSTDPDGLTVVFSES